VTLKVVSGDILHKSSVGGVALDVRGSDEVSRAFARIDARVRSERPGASIRGVLVSPQRAVAAELIVGGLRSETFGPMVMLGLGGVLVELIGDVVFALAPIGIGAALELLDRLTGDRPLVGGSASPDARRSVAEVVVAVGEIICAGERVTSIEVNPLALTDAGPVALDSRVVLDG
jgi:acetyltransferase